MINKIEWWENQGGFFGEKYMEGDNSVEGFRTNKKEDIVERTKREVKGIIGLTKIKKSDKILDIPCGYGRHSIELSKRGFEVKGMDINDLHLKKAKENSKDQEIVFLKKDMRDIGKEYYGKFDCVINMFYSFGFFKDEKDNEKTMHEFYNVLKEGGRLILHTDISPEMFNSGKYKFREQRNLNNGSKLLIEEKYNNQNKRMEGSWTIVSKNGQQKLTPYSVRIYTKEEFKSLAKKIGFNKVNFYGSFEGTNFTPDSSELIMIAEK